MDGSKSFTFVSVARTLSIMLEYFEGFDLTIQNFQGWWPTNKQCSQLYRVAVTKSKGGRDVSTISREEKHPEFQWKLRHI